jgi:hypothetical protein
MFHKNFYARPKSAVGSSEMVRCSQRHSLKTWPEYFEALTDGTKTFEVRKDDRTFVIGDELWLREFYPDIKLYSGREVVRRVAYILRGPAFGVRSGYCVMALAASNVPDKLRGDSHLSQLPGLSAVQSLASAGWLDALCERWVRTRDTFQETYAAQGTKYHEGYADAIYDLLQDVKRTVESASNDGAQVRP